MSDEQVKAMLSELVLELDYDLWKSFFCESYIEDPEMAADMVSKLQAIARKYIKS